MKKLSFLLIAISILSAASTALAAHDHGGSHDSTQHNAHQHEQNAKEAETVVKETEAVLDNCARRVNSIQRRINNLKGDLGRRSTTSILEELKKLEQTLKEADEIVRPLQVF